MGAVARGSNDNWGYVIGIIPEFMKKRELTYTETDKLFSVITMRERKPLMDTQADAFLVRPSGWGTLEELLETLTLAHLDTLRKFIVIFSQGGTAMNPWPPFNA